jgi:hypothetical protein
MKRSDAKRGVKVVFRGEGRTIQVTPTGKPFIVWKGGKKWQWEKWELAKSKKTSKKTTSQKKTPSSKNKTSKPTLHLVWKKHPSNDKFTKHFKKLEGHKVEKEKQMSSQGWYCLGSTNNIGYIGLVGGIWKENTQSKNTIRKRWNYEHDKDDLKFPKGFFKLDKIKIKNRPAHLHTASIVAARRHSRQKEKWKPRLYNTGPTQARMIERIEAFIIYHTAKWHKDMPKEKTKKFYIRSGNGWKGGKNNPKPYKFPSTKTMVNYTSVGEPPSKTILSGDFNIIFSGDMPEDLKKIFSKGVYVKDELNPKKK